MLPQKLRLLWERTKWSRDEVSSFCNLSIAYHCLATYFEWIYKLITLLTCKSSNFFMVQQKPFTSSKITKFYNPYIPIMLTKYMTIPLFNFSSPFFYSAFQLGVLVSLWLNHISFYWIESYYNQRVLTKLATQLY